MDDFLQAAYFISSIFLVVNCTVLFLISLTIYLQRTLHHSSLTHQLLYVGSITSFILYILFTVFTMNNEVSNEWSFKGSFWFGAIMLLLTAGWLELSYPKLDNIKKIKKVCCYGSVAIIVLSSIIPISIFLLIYVLFMGTCVWYLQNKVKVSVNELFNNITTLMAGIVFLQLVYILCSSFQVNVLFQTFLILLQCVFLLYIFSGLPKWSNRIVKNSVQALKQHQSTEHVAPKPSASINNMIPEEPSKVTTAEIQSVEAVQIKVTHLTKKEEPVIPKVSSSEHFSNLQTVEEKRPEPPIKITEEPSSNNTDSASKPIIGATRSMDAFNTNLNLHVEKTEEKRPEPSIKNTEESTLNHTEHPEPQSNDTDSANQPIRGETKPMDLFSKLDPKPPVELKKNVFDDLK